MATQTITFLFADTTMLQRLGNAGAGGRADHRRPIRPGLAAHDG
jgi:hypothetical protein